MMDLNQKVIKAWPEKTITTACLQNVSAKLGVKKWEGICSKGAYFQGFTVNMYQLTNFLWHKLWRCVTKSYITWAHIGLSAKA